MLGQTIEAKPPSRLGPILLLGPAGLLGGVAVVTGNIHWAIAGAFFVVGALVWWRLGKKNFKADLTQTGLEIHEPPQSISYASIEGLQARRPANPYKSGPRSYPIRVIHADGAVQVPGRLNVPSDELYSFLYHRLSSSGSRDVDPALVDYLRQKEERYGSDRVWTYARRAYTGGSVLSEFWLHFWLACLFTGLIWIAAGISLSAMIKVEKGFGWCLGGILLAVVSGTAALVVWGSARGKRSRPSRKGYRSSLVICPDGLALRQGELVGQLRWDEVRRIHLTGRTLTLKVEGADIILQDIYDRPLPLILQLLTHYYEADLDTERPVWHFDATRLRDADDRGGAAGQFTDRRDEYRG